jgi:hypothetical protein
MLLLRHYVQIRRHVIEHIHEVVMKNVIVTNHNGGAIVNNNFTNPNMANSA